MSIRISLKPKQVERLLERLHQAYAGNHLRLVKRIHTILYAVEGRSANDIAEIMGLSEQCVRNYVSAFVLKGLDSLAYQRPSGRVPKLTKTQKRELGGLLDKGPEAAGYDLGGWTSALIQDLILTHFGVEYSPQYIAELLKNLGFSWQKACFASEHLEDVSEEQREWMTKKWPELLRQARELKAWLLFGDECSFAQWGSLSYTWARRGCQPTVKTSGKRQAYKVWGFIEYFSGALLYQGQTGKLNSDGYQVFIRGVLKRTQRHVIIVQDGARYHTSKAMQEFFAAHADRLTVHQLPRYSPKFNPIEFFWRNLKKHTTHLRYFPTFDQLVEKVDSKLRYFAELPSAIKAVMGRYYETAGAKVAAQKSKSFS
jgi:transposase